MWKKPIENSRKDKEEESTDPSKSEKRSGQKKETKGENIPQKENPPPPPPKTSVTEDLPMKGQSETVEVSLPVKRSRRKLVADTESVDRSLLFSYLKIMDHKVVKFTER